MLGGPPALPVPALLAPPAPQAEIEIATHKAVSIVKKRHDWLPVAWVNIVVIILYLHHSDSRRCFTGKFASTSVRVRTLAVQRNHPVSVVDILVFVCVQTMQHEKLTFPL